MFARMKLESFHMAGLITLLNWFTEPLRLMVPDYSNRASLAGSRFKTEEDHLQIKIVTALLFIMPEHYLVT